MLGQAHLVSCLLLFFRCSCALSADWTQRLLDNAAAVRFRGSPYWVNNRVFMHFHYLSFLLGLLFAMILLPCLIIYLLYRWSVKEDERLFRIQNRLDDFQEDDVSR
jgi:hypothetical protein